MCGICGYITKTKSDLEAMTNSMIHRGPDDQGTYTDTAGEFHIGLGHRRLSIIDLSSAGHQPMPNKQKTLFITFNGEIYNFKDIKKELIADGYTFNSQTDTEVILYAYEKWGVKCLEKFNGMFAFAIWDKKNKQLFMARDRLGIKPLYYTTLNSKYIVFASEIKAILKSYIIPPKINLKALHYFLSYLRVPGELTMFENIKKLLPGHYLIWESGNIKIREYWDLKPQEYYSFSENKLSELFLNNFHKAINRRLISDVPLGAFLSGGIDSSSIVALMAKINKGPLKTFTIGVETKDQKIEQYSSDVDHARLLRAQLGEQLDYQEIVIKPDIAELLPKTIWHLEDPVADPAAINTYLICKLAKERGTTVILSGMGGDELMAGYRRHQLGIILSYFDKYKLGPLLLLTKKLSPILREISHMPFNIYIRFLKRISRYLNLPADQRYAGISSWLSNEEFYQLISKDLKSELFQHNAQDIHLNYFNKYPEKDLLWKMLYTDIKTFLVDLNLHYTDKMSMSVSSEVRVPFLDHKLLEFAFKLPPHLKMRGTTTKYLLKKSMNNILPKEIIKRSKAGFGAPIRSWLRTDLKPLVNDLLSPRRIKQRGYFNPRIIETMIKENSKGKQDYNYQIWALLTFEIWHQIFIDKK